MYISLCKKCVIYWLCSSICVRDVKNCEAQQPMKTANGEVEPSMEKVPTIVNLNLVPTEWTQFRPPVRTKFSFQRRENRFFAPSEPTKFDRWSLISLSSGRNELAADCPVISGKAGRRASTLRILFFSWFFRVYTDAMLCFGSCSFNIYINSDKFDLVPTKS